MTIAGEETYPTDGPPKPVVPIMYCAAQTLAAENIFIDGLHVGARLTPSLDSIRTYAYWRCREHGRQMSVFEVDVSDIPLVYEGLVDEQYGPQYRARQAMPAIHIRHKETLVRDAGGLPVVTQVPA